jgi:hypothetical protein
MVFILIPQRLLLSEGRKEGRREVHKGTKENYKANEGIA